jgi:predicted aldo/keto reductase-like oxidoreductase
MWCKEQGMILNKIIMGGMRFTSRESAGEVIRHGIDSGFNYIDTSPCYCNTSEEENSESWIGTALADKAYRNKILVSTKCSVGNGGLGFGDFNPSGGFGVTSADQLRTVFNQSLKRLNLDRVDYYHLWTTHTREQFTEAQKPNGWFAGVDALRSEGKFDHLGITTHADNDTIIHFLESGKFETVTIPLNIINTTRMRTVEYCAKNNIAVIAMNPLAGGFLGKNPKLAELAFEFLLGLDNVHLPKHDAQHVVTVCLARRV